MNNKFIKALIWGGFMALLAVSMPKVAWVFRSYEGAPLLINFFGFTFDALWIVPLLVSFCIDGLILALTYAVTQDKQKAGKAGLWVFIGTLCTLSYYCNLLYNFAHEPVGALWTNWFIGAVTPLIVSGVPLFALYYTFTLSRLEGKGETLEAKAARLELEKAAKDRIKQAKQGRIIRGIGGAIKQVRQEYISIKNEGKEPGIPALNGEQNEGLNEVLPSVKIDYAQVQNEGIEQGKMEVKAQDSEIQTSPQIALTPDVLELINAFPNLGALLATSRKTATINEIAEALNVSPKLVSNRVKSGQLKHAPRNAKLITITSVCELAKMLYAQAQNESITRSLHPVKPAQNGHNAEAITDALESVNLGEKAS